MEQQPTLSGQDGTPEATLCYDQPNSLTTRDPSISALTPSAFLEAMAGKVTALHECAYEPVRLRAIPLKPAAPGQIYCGFIYASVRDPRTTDSFSAKVPVQLVESLEWGREAILVGTIRYKPHRGAIHPEFRLDAVEGVGDARVLSKSDLMARWQHAIARAKADVRTVLLVERPRVLVITGAGSVALNDIRAQLREAEADIDLQVMLAAMSRPEEVAGTLRQAAAGAHLLVLTRGGGQDVHDLDADVLIEAVAFSPTPVAVALGHASDDLVVSRVADLSFLTPTDFGAWLRQRVEEKWAHARRLQEGKVLEQTGLLAKQVEKLQKELEAAQRDCQAAQAVYREASASAAHWRRATLALAATLAVGLLAGVPLLLRFLG